MNRLIKTILLLSICFHFAQGQEERPIFTQDQLLWYIENYHPIAQQGKLLIQQGESSVRAARGGFDPKLFANFDQKQFEDKEYYSILNSGLKIPTWYGLEFKTGFDQNSGVYLNPENKVPNGGLWYGGVSVSLGQGLFIDKRRAALQKANVFASSTVAEQKALMNELYFDAIKQYWKWVQAYNEYRVYEESVSLAVIRFEAVKNSHLLGDKPAIDTLEAKIQVQNRELGRNEYQLAYQNATLELSNYLWFENNTPLEITDELRPPLFNEIELNNVTDFDSLQTIVDAIPSAHPDMQIYDFKLSSLEIEKKLKAEEIKPKVNLNYNFLSEPVGNDFTSNISSQDYKWGIEFSLPLFLREQRGNLQLAKFKIQSTTFQQRQKQQEIENKVLSYYNEHVTLRAQVEIYREAVNNYSRLLEGERIKFDMGESSLFLMNSRESSLIEARLKAISLVSKFNISSAGIDYASGRLFR